MRYELHPRNTNFEWRQSVPPYRRLSEAEVRAYTDDGFVAVRDAFSAEEVAAVTATIDPLEAKTEAFLRTRDDGTFGIEVEAGSIVVFSSLTPHRTGPNVTTGVRKSYIMQYAPDGAIAYPQGKHATPCDAADRQYLVLREGRAA